MKFSHKICVFILLFSLKAVAFQSAIKINNEKVGINLKAHADIFTSEKEFLLSDLNFDVVSEKSTEKEFFYFDFNQKSIFIKFHLLNQKLKERKLFIRFSNTMIYEIILYKKNSKALHEIYRVGIKHPINTKQISNRNFIFPIKIKPKEAASYVIKLHKMDGRPLVTNIELLDENSLNDTILKENLILGIYLGLSAIFLLVGIVLFILFKKSIYILYSLYILFLGLFITSYTGVFQEFFLSQNTIVNKYTHYVLFSEIALVFFVLFSQKFLSTKNTIFNLNITVLNINKKA